MHSLKKLFFLLQYKLLFCSRKFPTFRKQPAKNGKEEKTNQSFQQKIKNFAPIPIICPEKQKLYSLPKHISKNYRKQQQKPENNNIFRHIFPFPTTEKSSEKYVFLNSFSTRVTRRLNGYSVPHLWQPVQSPLAQYNVPHSVEQALSWEFSENEWIPQPLHSPLPGHNISD